MWGKKSAKYIISKWGEKKRKHSLMKFEMQTEQYFVGRVKHRIKVVEIDQQYHELCCKPVINFVNFNILYKHSQI